MSQVTHLTRLCRIASCITLLALTACQTTKKVAYQPPPPTPQAAPRFMCDTNAQEVICGNAMLTKLDQQLNAAFHRNLQISDSIGREHLIADQQRWLIGRANACQTQTLLLDYATPPSPTLAACLGKLYSARIEALQQWPQPTKSLEQSGKTAHPLSAYVEFRPAEYSDPALCGTMAETFNAALRAHGDLDLAHIPGIKLLAGTHRAGSAASTTANNSPFKVDLHNAGPYAGYALRARTLKHANGNMLLDEGSLGSWIRRLPNHGGRPNNVASQTGDYGSIDVFEQAGLTLALVAEPWGKYAPGAQGEWAYAGLYRIGSNSAAEALCLYRTFMTPPLKSPLDHLPAYTTLQQQLEQIHGPIPAELTGRDLQEDYLFKRERQWQQQNMPLLAVADAQRNGWNTWLRMRQDAVLNALFSWSERKLHNKLALRHLLALLPAASEELTATYQRTQRLSAIDAREAAQLGLMRMLADAASDLPGLAVNLPKSPKTAPQTAKYTPKYPILTTEADLQRDRSYTGLYSAALNGADKEAIDDYLKYEAVDKNRQTHGADGETPLMAAVESPEIVRQLLAAGASANETDSLGKTPLMNAAEAGQAESARLLIAAGAKIGSRSKASDETPGGQTACQRIKTTLTAQDKAALQGLLCGGL